MRIIAKILGACVVVGAMLVVSCSDNMKPERSAGALRSKLGISGVQMPTNFFEERQNPLIAHIRANWTGGDPNKTGGLHYPHIKVFGLCWKDIGGAGWDPAGEQAEFIADHFDMYVWGGYGVADHAYPQYPSFLWLETTGSNNITSNWDLAQTMSWDSSGDNEESVTWNELVMHFKHDGHNVWDGYRALYGEPPESMFRGWNPSDDTNGNGCIEAGEGNNGQPSDTTRTATCISRAEIKDYVGGSGRKWWNWTEISPSMTRGYEGNIDMRSDRMAARYNGYAKKFKGCLVDNVAFNQINYGLEKSFSYESNDYNESNAQYYVNKVAWISAFAVALDQKIASPLTVYIGNVCSPLFTCVSGNGKEWFQEYLENCWDENWIAAGGGDILTTDEIECKLNCPYLDYCQQGKGYVFSAKSYANSYRERRFLLATFYMINHQMAFFYYRINNPSWYDDHTPMSSEDKVWNWQWNSYVPFDVGQPIVNTIGKVDFQGNSNTNRYFVFASNTNYKVLGREFMRADGQRVLVLTKIMASGRVEGQDPTTLLLPKCYEQVQPDLSLGQVINQVTLYNSDAAILVEVTCPPGGKDGPVPEEP